MGILGALMGVFKPHYLQHMFNIKTMELIKLREAKGYNQEKIGELLIMDRSNYGKIERGERELTLRMAYQIAEILEAEIESFVNLPNVYNHIIDGTFTNTGIGGSVTINNSSPFSDKIIILLDEAIALLKKSYKN